MAETTKSTAVAVIGAGPGGYAAAFMAADLGLQVTLIDPEENPGGVCLYRGCIPSKALLHVARLISESRDSAEWGITFGEPTIDVKKLRAWKEGVVKRLTGGVGQLAKQRKVEFLRGMAKFIDAKTLAVDAKDGGKIKLSFEHAIIATGSRPAMIPSLALKSSRVINSTGALAIKDIPKSMLVVGGGYIGLEMGTVYATLGAKVTVVEMLPSILPGVDRDLVSILAKRLDGLFDKIILNTTVSKMKEQKNGIKVSFESKEGEPQEKLFDKVLVSVGRKPNSENLGLENTKVKIADRGFIEVNLQRQTAEPTIYAIGDVAGEPMLAHKASHEGRVAAEAIAGKKVAFEPQAIPAVVFTDPEIAWCGVTQTQAKEQGLNVEVIRFPWAASGRSLTLGRTDGVTKLVIDKDTGRVLGVGITGPNAGDLIAEGVLAIEMGAVAEDLGLTIHPHPTLSETLMEAADVFYGTSTHYYRPKKK
jgi:dihydrolipoamide dehydrogenase